VILARYHGLPYQRVAAALGISEGAVKTRIHRAIESLRRRLSDETETKNEEGWTWTATKPGS
jgi:DNA-directed RNA polymerase specialized sigma24 family protein